MERDYVFDPDALKELLVHFSDGFIPLNGIVTGFFVNEFLGRVIALEVESDEWENTKPVHIRYDHDSQIFTWTQDNAEEPVIEQRNDTPRIM